MTTLLLDYDAYLFKAAAIGETRSIQVVHRTSGDEYDFANRTAFYGKSRAKNGGWLAEYNAGRPDDLKRSADEFDITDIQTPGDITHCFKAVKEQIASIAEAAGADNYYGYSGRGASFREGISTILKYKGQREGVQRPVYLNEVRDYMIRRHNCQIVTGIEADDAVAIDSYAAWYKWSKTKSDKDKVVLAYVDKDTKQNAGHLYNTNRNTWLSQGYDLGKLWLAKTPKGDNEVDGCGRMWLYYQTLSGDDADNYCANSANPAMKWGEMTAYKLLKDAKSDKEAWEALVKGYKTLYPGKKKIVGWRGYDDPKDMKILKPDFKDYEIEVDWLHCLTENFHLAKMLRTREEQHNPTSVVDVLNKLGVEYDK